jgi:hypothetical protein
VGTLPVQNFHVVDAAKQSLDSRSPAAETMAKQLLLSAFCYRNLETVDHLFVECPVVRQIWSEISVCLSGRRSHNSIPYCGLLIKVLPGGSMS